MHKLPLLFIAIALALVTTTGGAEQPNLHLLPTPKEVKLSTGKLDLPQGCRVIAAQESLAPLARVLADELQKVTGQKFDTATGAARDGDIELHIDPTLGGGDSSYWPYVLKVGARVEIAGGDYNATAMGTATLLQLLNVNNGAVSLPRVDIRDSSAAEFAGLMLDVARQNNTLQDVRNCVELCRLYKARYLQLHLNDMESFMFPSQLFPKLGAHNGSAHGGPKCERWSRDELLATIRYADERGVAIVPELETVFHTGAMMQDMPEEFGGPGVLNMGSERLYKSLKPLIEEMCDVFKSSPFFHIGCDEASIGGVMEAPGTKEYMAEHDIKSGEDLYRFHINRLDKIVTRKGKRTIVWQDCPLPLDNKKIICMLWHMDLDHGDTANVIKAGYPTIQVTWTPSCYSPVKDLFAWRAFDDQIKPSKLAMGSQLVLWEQNGSVAIPYLRQKLPARQQFTYSPAAEQTYEQFAADLTHTDSLLDPLLTGIAATEIGLNESVGQWLSAGGSGETPPYTFTNNLQLSLKSNLPGAKIHYTIPPIRNYDKSWLYGAEPTAKSEIADDTITIKPPDGEAVCVQARLFNSAGEPLGATWTRTYRWEPFVVSVAGTVAPGDYRFGEAATVALTNAVPGGAVRHAIDRPVDAKSPTLEKPIVIDKSGEVSIGYFDADGKQRGLLWKQNFRKVDFDPTNITYKKPVILWGSSSKQAAEVAVDGVVDHDQFLDIQPAPQQFGIDLQDVKQLNKIVLYTYWDGGRFYQYTIDVSTDGKEWRTVADASKNTERATERGYAHTFAAAAARYLRVTMLHNSANPGLHIVELRAYEAK